MEKSHCLPVLQLLLASSKNSPELKCMAHTKNWLHLSHKKPFRDCGKWLWRASHILTHHLTSLAICQLKQASTDIHDLYKIEAFRPTQQLYLPYVKHRIGHRNMTRLTECLLVCTKPWVQFRTLYKPDKVAYICNPSIGEVMAWGSWVQDHPLAMPRSYKPAWDTGNFVI